MANSYEIIRAKAILKEVEASERLLLKIAKELMDSMFKSKEQDCSVELRRSLGTDNDSNLVIDVCDCTFRTVSIYTFYSDDKKLAIAKQLKDFFAGKADFPK